MNHLRVVYPCLLAAANAGTGWVLYRSLAPALGIVLLATGLLVFLTVTVQVAQVIRNSCSSLRLKPS